MIQRKLGYTIDRLSPVKNNQQRRDRQYTDIVPKQKSNETIDCCYSDTSDTVTESVPSDDESIVSNAVNLSGTYIQNDIRDVFEFRHVLLLRRIRRK